MTYKEKYKKHFGYALDEYYPCEVCRAPAVHVHHAKFKSRGGNDDIENLVGVCYKCHNDCHNEILSERDVLYIHRRFMVATTGPMGKKL